MTDPNTAENPAARHARLAPVDTAADALFVYGTLRFDRILTALLGRVPPGTPATAPGWRTAALAGRPYPGLVPSAGHTAAGLLLTGLSGTEWRALDDFEDDAYELRRLAAERGPGSERAPAAEQSPAPERGGTENGRTAGSLSGPGRIWTYVWAAPGEVAAEDWSADVFAARQLEGYAARLEAAAAAAARHRGGRPER
ncbi:gamma-glutamylcyclotransferase family protein [Streptomyces sp. WMMB303]|uniref:gamma-glutamylcyclotransferase family protein n=1 Tax=Streptomyces sp. WMMB303 TaxID=3034154 RepID=UPI0023EAD012|nr:gamma-glutamylcyclotransferase family protein [Streptomyces sp. WMMB303]MDF4250539.1 gamma-glutamylcyclotransferase [Streptomyces sp. WMMB303]